MKHFPLQRHSSKLTEDSDDEDAGPAGVRGGAGAGGTAEAWAADENADPQLQGLASSHCSRYAAQQQQGGKLAPAAPFSQLQQGGGGLAALQLAATAHKKSPWQLPVVDSRASSTTPDMFMLSPSTMALQQKYGSSDSASLPFPVTSSSAEPSPPDADDMDMDDPPGECQCTVGHMGEAPRVGHSLG